MSLQGLFLRIRQPHLKATTKGFAFSNITHWFESYSIKLRINCGQK